MLKTCYESKAFSDYEIPKQFDVSQWGIKSGLSDYRTILFTIFNHSNLHNICGKV